MKTNNKKEINEEKLLEILKKLAPGTSIRVALDDLMRAEMGALIVINKEGLDAIVEGGFRVNCRFSPQRLVELSKMDGAVIISEDFKKIISANTLLTPSTRYSTKETGTRHKAAERTAKQIKTLTIAVSKRKKKITVYYGDLKYELEKTSEVLSKTTETIQILEKQKEKLDEAIAHLNILEINNLVTTNDVCNVLQRIEIIKKISEVIKRDLISLGKEGTIISTRLKEITKNINQERELILKDYFPSNYQQIDNALNQMNFDFLLEISNINRIIFEETHDKSITSKGLRILSKTSLLDKEKEMLMSSYGSLDKIFETNMEEMQKIFKNENLTKSIFNELYTLREKIISGKKI